MSTQYSDIYWLIIMSFKRSCTCTLKYKNGVPVVSPCLKNLLFVANFLTWLVGLLMVGIGTYAKIDKSYSNSISGLPLDPVAPILFIGGLVFFVAFFGCVGALRENICMLTFFSYVLVVALLFELCIAFGSVLLSDTFREKIESTMFDSIVHYRDDPDLHNIVDWVQEEFKCCGVNNLDDWSINEYFNCSNNNPSMERCGVPYSCCKPDNTSDVINSLCGMHMQRSSEYDEVLFNQGCLDAFLTWVHDNLFWITFLMMLLCCIPQILGITISRILIVQIKDQDLYINIGLLNSRGEFEFN